MAKDIVSLEDSFGELIEMDDSQLQIFDHNCQVKFILNGQQKNIKKGVVAIWCFVESYPEKGSLQTTCSS